MEPIVDLALDAVSYAVAAKPLELARELPRGLPRIAGDRERLAQALVTLLANAVQFTPKGRDHGPGGALGRGRGFSVADTGPGVPADRCTTFFQRFLDDAALRRPAGGRPVRGEGIVEAHGGAIWAESAPGQGDGVLRPRREDPRRARCRYLRAESQRRRIARPSVSKGEVLVPMVGLLVHPRAEIHGLSTPSSRRSGRRRSTLASARRPAAPSRQRHAPADGRRAASAEGLNRARSISRSRRVRERPRRRAAPASIDVPGAKRWFRLSDEGVGHHGPASASLRRRRRW